jgi:enolase-phosphatase E1
MPTINRSVLAPRICRRNRRCNPVEALETRAILLDIEGTTTPVEFVYQTLFPFARHHLSAFLAAHGNDEGVLADITRLREEHRTDVGNDQQPPAWRDEAEIDSAIAYVYWLMERDRKSTGLKALQGKIWEAGYRSGELLSEVYDDVPHAFERWRKQGKTLAIFSSGSVLAQRLLFAHTAASDLTGYLSAYFDTTTGAKQEAESYRRIAGALALPTSAILFLSDVMAELDAARQAGMQTALCVRAVGAPSANTHPLIRTFDEIP